MSLLLKTIQLSYRSAQCIKLAIHISLVMIYTLEYFANYTRILI